MSGVAVDVAIPVLNEEKRLRAGVEGLLSFCEKQGLDAAVTVADNGSKDKTGEVAAELVAASPKVRYLSVGQKGVGRALKKAWSSSERDIVGYMDVDLATDLSHFPEFIAKFQDHPGELVVTGSRLLPGSKVAGRSLLREITSRGFNSILSLLLDVKFTDGMCGFKFLRRSTFNRLMETGLENNDWFFNTEILVKAEWSGIRVIDLPVRWSDDGDSRVRLFETTYKYMREIFRLRALCGKFQDG